MSVDFYAKSTCMNIYGRRDVDRDNPEDMVILCKGLIDSHSQSGHSSVSAVLVVLVCCHGNW